MRYGKGSNFLVNLTFVNFESEKVKMSWKCFSLNGETWKHSSVNADMIEHLKPMTSSRERARVIKNSKSTWCREFRTTLKSVGAPQKMFLFLFDVGKSHILNWDWKFEKWNILKLNEIANAWIDLMNIWCGRNEFWSVKSYSHHCCILPRAAI